MNLSRHGILVIFYIMESNIYLKKCDCCYQMCTLASDIKEVKHESNLTFHTHRLLIFERKQRGSIWIIRLSSSAKVTHNYAMIVRRLQSLKISFHQQFDFGQQPVFFVIWWQEEHGQTDSVQNGCHGQRDREGGGGVKNTHWESRNKSWCLHQGTQCMSSGTPLTFEIWINRHTAWISVLPKHR